MPLIKEEGQKIVFDYTSTFYIAKVRRAELHLNHFQRKRLHEACADLIAHLFNCLLYLSF